MDIILTPKDIQKQIAKRVKKARLAANLTQASLAARSGVTLASLKRFERTSEISLASLAKLAFALQMEHDFETIFMPRQPETLDELLATEQKDSRKRGSQR